MTSVVKLVRIIDAPVRFEGTLEVTQGSSRSKQNEHWSQSRLFRALFSWIVESPRMEDLPCLWVPAVF